MAVPDQRETRASLVGNGHQRAGGVLVQHSGLVDQQQVTPTQHSIGGRNGELARPEDRPVDPVQRPGRFPYIVVYLMSDDEYIDVLAPVSVRCGSTLSLPAGQTSSRGRCSPQTVRKKSVFGPQQPSAADHRISVSSQVRGIFRRKSTTPVDRRKPASSFRFNV